MDAAAAGLIAMIMYGTPGSEVEKVQPNVVAPNGVTTAVLLAVTTFPSERSRVVFVPAAVVVLFDCAARNRADLSVMVVIGKVTVVPDVVVLATTSIGEVKSCPV